MSRSCGLRACGFRCRRGTGTELAVRKLLYSHGYRYRLHRRDLPGRPDIALGPKRKAIFAHGCFWHGHDCPNSQLPKSKLNYWGPKIEANKERHRRKQRELEELGWDVMTIWQCELANAQALWVRIGVVAERRPEA
ncbi:MAG: very short patch repair endonuclease [Yangia sp.]|nr:very short patch repair endonuclease [Salipiger sp.]